MIKWWQYILFPFAVLYNATTRFRNHLYNIEYKPSFQFETNVICVGNLAVGGTGKTPAVMYLVNHLLQNNRKVAILSRGYGRRTRGFRIVDSQDNASTVGDEPSIFYDYFKDQAMVAVGEDRALAIPRILFERPDTDTVVMDDGFQHRQVRPSLSIILTTYDRLFYHDFVMPVGLLRESRVNLSRADVVVVTKCPDTLTQEERSTINSQIREYKSNIPVFFAEVSYGQLQPVPKNETKPRKKIILVTSIANTEALIARVNAEFEIVRHFKYRDHYKFKESDLLNWSESSRRQNASIITTEKDFVKIRELDGFSALDLFVWPIEMKIIDREEDFLKIIDDSLKDYSQTE